MSLGLLRYIPEELNGVLTILLFVSVPLVPFLIAVKCIARQNHWEGSGRNPFIYNCFYVLNKFAGVIAFFNIIWSVVVAFCQAGFVARSLSLGSDISYYMKVALPEYESVNNINSASSLNSLNIVFMDFNGRRKLSDESSYDAVKNQLSLNTSDHLEQLTQLESLFSDKMLRGDRSLTQYGATQTMSIIYHTKDWDNILTEDGLKDICRTEQNIISQMNCVNTHDYKSILPSIFNLNTCEYSTSYAQSLYKFGLAESEPFVEDGVNPRFPRSDILISYFAVGFCRDDFTEEELQAQFNTAEVGDITTTYVSSSFVQDEFIAAIMDALYWSAAAIILCIGFMVLGVRGVLISITTLFCIVISVVHAAAILPYWEYGSFSAFNVLSVFILLGVGANAVLMFGSSWRRVVTHPEIERATELQVMETYSAVSQSILFTTAAACLSLFSKLASPVVVISQLGAFMGVAVAVFYVLLHYILIPMWIWSSRVTLPLAVHKWSNRQKALCFGYVWSCFACSSASISPSNNNISNIRHSREFDYTFVNSYTPADQQQPQPQQQVQAQQELQAQIHYQSVECGNAETGEGMTGQLEASSAADTPVENCGDNNNNDKCNSNNINENNNSSNGNSSAYVSAGTTIIAPTEIVVTAPSVNSSETNSNNSNNNSSSNQSLCSRLSTFMCDSNTVVILFALLTLCAALFGLLLVYHFVTLGLQVDFGIPQLFNADSNIGQAMFVVKNYKTQIFSVHQSSVDFSPTAAPVIARPSRPPTLAPTNPTFTPTTSRPSVTPSARPSAPTVPPTKTGKPSMKPSAVPSHTMTPSRLPTTSLPSRDPTSFTPSRTPTTVSPSQHPTTIAPSQLPTTVSPSEIPSTLPSNAPSVRPTTVSPTFPPTTTASPSPEPTIEPSSEPSAVPSFTPTSVPTFTTTIVPTATTVPSANPSLAPSATIAPSATREPSNTPAPTTFKPTVTNKPTAPTLTPSSRTPTISNAPSISPSTVKPTTAIPSAVPSYRPSCAPSTTSPSATPTLTPTDTNQPSASPSEMPSEQPSLTPSAIPSEVPTVLPSEVPSSAPTTQPSSVPSQLPTALPSVMPSMEPTATPSSVPSVVPTTLPSITPTVVPSDLPTREPTEGPSTEPTTEPTASPSFYATTQPSYAQTVAPSPPPVPPPPKHTDYTVTGCWGIYTEKEFVDSDSELSFDHSAFDMYSKGIVNENNEWSESGLLYDMESMCNYIESDREALDVHPDWDRDRDCLYQQFLEAAESLYWRRPTAPQKTVSNVLMFWGSRDYTSGKLIGIEMQNKTYVKPLWLCMNISARTIGVSSLIKDTPLAVTLSDRWNNAFKTYAAKYADQYNIPVVIGSTEFTFPMLASEVLFSIELSAIISVAGFVGLLYIFTLSDISLTLLGTLGMLSTIAVSICVHEYVYPGYFDLLDIVVLIAIMGMAVDFPIHLVVEYVNERHAHDQKKEKEKRAVEDGQSRGVQNFSRSNSGSSVVVPQQSGSTAEESSALVVTTNDHDIESNGAHQRDEQTSQDSADNSSNSSSSDCDSKQRDKSILKSWYTPFSPALSDTNQYMRVALIAPLILAVLSGLPLLFAEFTLLRKCGQYIVIMSLVSYAMCALFIPYLLPLGCRVTCLDRYCYGSGDSRVSSCDKEESPSTSPAAVPAGIVTKEIQQADEDENDDRDDLEISRKVSGRRVVIPVNEN